MNTFDKFNLAERAEQIFADGMAYLSNNLKMNRVTTPCLPTAKDVKEIDLEIAPLQAFVHKGETIKQRLESGDTFGSISGVTAMIAELERQFAGAHAEMILRVADSSLRKFFEKLAEQDRGHASLLCQ